MTSDRGNGVQGFSSEIMEPMRQIGIRVDDDLHRWLSEIARTEHRTLNGQVIHALEWYRREMERRERTERERGE
jgi:hypothetical protein